MSLACQSDCTLVEQEHDGSGTEQSSVDTTDRAGNSMPHVSTDRPVVDSGAHVVTESSDE